MPRVDARTSAHAEPHTPSLLRGLLFALFAGLGALPWQLLFGAAWDSYSVSASAFNACLGPYLLGLVVAALIACAPSWRRALLAGSLGACLCGPLALTLPGIATALLGALAVLSLARNALLYPRPFARALACELGLGLLSVAAFALMHDGGPIGNSLAVWSFWLVQSAFALLPGSTRTEQTLERDPFETAVAAADALMQGR